MPHLGPNSVDIALLLSTVLVFSAWLALHLLLALAVARNLGKAQAVLGLLVCPLMPYFGYMSGARQRSVAWTVLGATYGVLLLAASR